jgi:hypothetical protein
MARSICEAFKPHVLTLPLEVIVPQRDVTNILRTTTSYKKIVTSIKEVGLIQPLIVFPNGSGRYLLLDGHLRLDVMQRLGSQTADCIVANDDESYTYNKRVNHLPPIAQHYMLLKALSKGLTEQRLATALNVDIGVIRQNRALLEGICPEVIEILKDKHLATAVFSILRKMKAFRQIEAAEHMVASARYTVTFAKALLAMTPEEFLADNRSGLRGRRKQDETHALLQQETESIVRDLKDAESCYGTDILSLTVACGYLQRVVDNNRVQKYLAKHYPEILHTLRGVIADVRPSVPASVAN